MSEKSGCLKRLVDTGKFFSLSHGNEKPSAEISYGKQGNDRQGTRPRSRINGALPRSGAYVGRFLVTQSNLNHLGLLVLGNNSSKQRS